MKEKNWLTLEGINWNISLEVKISVNDKITNFRLKFSILH